MMKKLLLLFVALLLLVGCNNVKTIKETLGESYQDFFESHKNDPPTSLIYSEGDTAIEITDKEAIAGVYETLLEMEVGHRSDIAVDAADKAYTFTFQNGETMVFIIINYGGVHFFFNPNDFMLYRIEDDKGLFDISLVIEPK